MSVISALAFVCTDGYAGRLFSIKLKSPLSTPHLPLKAFKSIFIPSFPMNIYNCSCRDGSELHTAIPLKYDTAVWSHWLKAIESWINWAVQYSDRMCPGQRSPPAQTSQEACDVHSVYELCFMKCYGKLCGVLIRCALRPEKRLTAVWVTGVPFQGGKGTFMSTTGHIGCGAHLNVNYKGFWHVLLLLWLNYCKTLSIVWCFERSTVFRK